jgi:hypothetical protein
MVAKPTWTFAELPHYLFPHLHKQTGLTNDVMDGLNEFIDECIESLTDEEIKVWNAWVLAENAEDSALEEIDLWNEHKGADAKLCWEHRDYILQKPQAERTDMETEDLVTLERTINDYDKEIAEL